MGIKYEQDGWDKRYIEGDSSFNGPVAFITIKDTPDGLIAHSFMQGPKRGDECMKLARIRLEQVAAEYGRPVTHIIQATNKGADALAVRSGYECAATNDRGHNIYLKVYGAYVVSPLVNCITSGVIYI